MADTKISALPASTVPLAGSELVPIVQSGVTEQVSIANLTAGRAIAFTTGTFSDNLIQGTAAKGINFTANTPAAGMTSRLLNAYEEGTWTPNQGSGLTVVGTFSSSGMYTRVGRLVMIQARYVGSTSIACSAFGVLSSNFPFNLSPNEFTGSAWGGTPAKGAVVTASGLTVYSIDAISAGGAIVFTLVCSI